MKTPRTVSILITTALFLGVICTAWALEYGNPRELCKLASKDADESSGLECATTLKNSFWTHNDDLGDSRLFAFDSQGKHKGTWRLPGAILLDWEDLSAFRLNNRNYLLCADVGDNFSARPIVCIYIIEEPDGQDPKRKLKIVNTILFSYEGGPRDCEAVAVDLRKNQIVLISKTPQAGQCAMYTLPLSLTQAKKPLVAKKISAVNISWVTSMDISADGTRAVIMALRDVYELSRKKDEDWPKAIQRGIRKVARLPRGQWEAICFGADDRTLYATKEQLPTQCFVIPAKK
jgi:hypothetical protein